MTFLDIVNAVLVDAFAEGKRAAAKTWVNHRYTWLCDLEEWSFMDATQAVSVASGSATVSGLPADLGPVVALLDQNGAPLQPLRDRQTYYDRYVNPTAPFVGQPEAFIVLGGSILVGPVANVTSSSFQLIYERVAALLVNDTDVPIIPSGYHVGLVQGGKAEGFRLSNIPLADQFDADFRGTIDAMRGKYLSSIRDKQRQSPAYRP